MAFAGAESPEAGVMLPSTGMPLSALRLGGAAVWGWARARVDLDPGPQEAAAHNQAVQLCVWCFLIVFKDRVKSLWA